MNSKEPELEFIFEFPNQELAQAALGHFAWLQFDGHNVSGCAENGSKTTISVWFTRQDLAEIEQLRQETGALRATPAAANQPETAVTLQSNRRFYI